MPSANIGGQILPDCDLTARHCARAIARQAHEVDLYRNAHGLGERDQRIHGPFQHRNEQRILIAVILARESGHLVDLGIDLFFADQLVVNIFLKVSDSHALHLGTRE